jgi:murein L,D-transpeptidase YcbB/YkuD
MRGVCLIAVLLYAVQALALAARAEGPVAPSAAFSTPAPAPASSAVSPGPFYQPQAAAETARPPSQADPMVQLIRAKLAGADIRKGANADDLAALEAFYAARTGGPLWVTEMGLSTKAQAALFEIEKADDWGLDAAAFELPSAAALPAGPEARALAEIKLDLAILKYARFARGGRLNPQAISGLFDQAPPLRDPKTVIAEVAGADAPGQYLQSLHPQHAQFTRLRQALLKARGKVGEGAKPAENQREVRRLILNMERWRWMPENLGSVYVWNNSPEFMLYVIKDGTTIFADKTLVGTINYATPVFTADMKTIVFNPDWTAPQTVVTEDLAPQLRRGNYSILRVHKLQANYQGKPIDPTRVDWGRVNVHAYSFTQRAGPDNVLGKVKFLFPNQHTVYMHDTVPARRKHFKESTRTLGHECVRMEKPQQFAEVLLAEDKGWTERQVKELWSKGLNSSVTINRKIPVHMTYFTAVVNDAGKVSFVADVYGLDRKLATALFRDTQGFPAPLPEAKQSPAAARSSASWGTVWGGIAR